LQLNRSNLTEVLNEFVAIGNVSLLPFIIKADAEPVVAMRQRRIGRIVLICNVPRMATNIYRSRFFKNQRDVLMNFLTEFYSIIF
jgi:hypothetical protein